MRAPLTSMGSTKAAVLPLPVLAKPRTSLPLSAAGSACAWMAVGRSYLVGHGGACGGGHVGHGGACLVGHVGHFYLKF